MNLPPSPGEMSRPGYYQEGEDGKMKHHPGFGEATRDYPGLPKLRIFLIAALVAAGIVGGLLFYPRSPSPDEWATRLAQALVVDGTTYTSEPEFEEALPRVQAAIGAWQEDSGCRMTGAIGIRDKTRETVREELDKALAEVRAELPTEGSFGIGWAIANRGKDFGGAVIVANCTPEQAPPMRGPFGQ